MDFTGIITALFKLVVLLAIGFIIYRKHFIDEHFNRGLSWLVVNITNPALILGSLASAGDIPQETVMKLVVFGIGYYLMLPFLAVLIVRICRIPRQDRGTAELLAVFSNTGFMAIPIMQTLYGDMSVFVINILNLPFNFLVYTYGIYLILCALGASIVMLVSPIYDSRSALYTVYLWILLTLLLFGRLPLTVDVKKCLLVLFVLLAGMRMFSYYQIYHLVHLINIRRNQQIEYYRVRPDAGDAWILAYPDESIHSPNVQEGDDTHMYYFKEYYYLNQDLHLVFYYLKDYNAETIFEVTQ